MIFRKTTQGVRKQVYNGEKDETTLCKFILTLLPKEDKVALHKKTILRRRRRAQEEELITDLKQKITMNDKSNGDISKASLSEIIDKMVNKYLGL
jgi:hypothetical protein